MFKSRTTSVSQQFLGIAVTIGEPEQAASPGSKTSRFVGNHGALFTHILGNLGRIAVDKEMSGVVLLSGTKLVIAHLPGQPGDRSADIRPNGSACATAVTASN
jgi:hypothetical protein